MGNKYFFMYEQNGQVKNIDFLKNYQDITEIDELTFHYQKEDFIQNNSFLKDKNIYIVKVQFFKNSKEFKVNIYEPLFKVPKAFSPQQYERLYFLLKSRQKKVEQNMRSIQYEDSPIYRTYVTEIITTILQNSQLKFYLARQKSAINPWLKRKLLEIDNKNYLFILDLLKKHLLDYMKLRSILIEYCNFYQQDLPKEKTTDIDNTLFQESIFGFKGNNYITPSEATMLKNTDDEEELANYAKISHILNTPFANEKLEIAYREGGIAKIMHDFDINELYESSIEDLLRLKLITEEEYLAAEKNTKFSLK